MKTVKGSDKLKLEALGQFHIGTEMEVTDPFMAETGADMAKKLREVKVLADRLNVITQELDTLKTLYWARLAEIMPGAVKFQFKATHDFKRVVVIGNFKPGFGGIIGGPVPPEVKEFIEKLCAGDAPNDD